MCKKCQCYRILFIFLYTPVRSIYSRKNRKKQQHFPSFRVFFEKKEIATHRNTQASGQNILSVILLVLLGAFTNAKVVGQTNGAYTQIRARTSSVCICAASSTSQAGMLRSFASVLWLAVCPEIVLTLPPFCQDMHDFRRTPTISREILLAPREKEKKQRQCHSIMPAALSNVSLHET